MECGDVSAGGARVWVAMMGDWARCGVGEGMRECWISFTVSTTVVSSIVLDGFCEGDEAMCVVDDEGGWWDKLCGSCRGGIGCEEDGGVRGDGVGAGGVEENCMDGIRCVFCSGG